MTLDASTLRKLRELCDEALKRIPENCFMERDDLLLAMPILIDAYEKLQVDSIHSCHDKCKRLACVQRREITRLREALEKCREQRNYYMRGITHEMLVRDNLDEEIERVLKGDE